MPPDRLGEPRTWHCTRSVSYTHLDVYKRQAGAFAIWLSLGWVVALASVRGLVEREGVFLRTPKRRGDVSWVDGIRANLVEVGLASLALGAIVTASVAAPGFVTMLLTGLLVLPLVGWFSAPVHSLAALRAELTPQLSDRRDREDGLAWWGPVSYTHLDVYKRQPDRRCRRRR